MLIVWGTKGIQKKLDFCQPVTCNHCGREGNIEVYKTYTAFTLFYIPTFIRWDVKYWAVMSCCGETVELEKEVGKDIKKGAITQLSKFMFKEGERVYNCPNCGNEYKGDYQYCPHCGEKI